MGWRNPPIPWREFERRLDGRVSKDNAAPDATRRLDGRADSQAPHGDKDGAAWSHKREPYRPLPQQQRIQSATPYAELHCHSNFSFLDGASPPEELAEEAAHLGLEAIALTDHDGLYGVVRFVEAARTVGIPTVFGAELTLDLPRVQTGIPDPEGTHVVVLARDPDGYARLSRTIAQAQMRGGEKGRPLLTLDELAGAHGGNWAVLTGCRKGLVPDALMREGPAAAKRALQQLIDACGHDNVVMELWDHGEPLDSERNDALAEIGARAGLQIVATNNVHYATPDRFPLASSLAAIRARRSLADMDGWLPPSSARHLRSGDEQARRFARYPGVVEAAAELGRACAFDLKLVAPNLPGFPVPPGHTEMTWLRHITMEGARRRYGPRHAERVKGAYAQIDHELDVIERLGFPGYFLIVWDITEFCRRSDIFCQGRGSAANSAVCYALGITNVDAVDLGLLFERFLSPERDGPPDIDVDIEAGRREEAIQYVYERYGRANAAQVANVVMYRPRYAVRDLGRAFGFPPETLNQWSRAIDADGLSNSPDIPEHVRAFADAVYGFPRHLSIHSGGMVICDRPVVDVVPTEWARKENRSVIQWDKDDCAAVGLVKFDLLGLGMLSALHMCVDLIREHHGVEVDLAQLQQEDAVYEMLSRADTVGVFQVESRAQMATLPRLRPRTFYDIVVEVALIRPGPIQGGAVHPYLKRRNGQEPVTYTHPILERALSKTLGVPLFQEQLMQMAIDAAGFTPAEADQLRQAMGSKRSAERMERLRERLYDGMAARGITGAAAETVFTQIAAFADFGFPESHAVSFAYLVYSSAWLKLHYPAAFCAALLNAQPMGFWSPASLVADARRHGVVVRGPDVNASAAKSTLEADDAVRVGIEYVRDVGVSLAASIAQGRPYTSIEDLVRRTNAPAAAVTALATAGAFDCLDFAERHAADRVDDRAALKGGGESRAVDRRAALWAAGVAARAHPGTLPGIVTGLTPDLPPMTGRDVVASDLWATGITTTDHPITFARPHLDSMNAVPIDALHRIRSGTRVTVGGVVTHRQRPSTANGTVFLSLEDETGMVNVICSRDMWLRHTRTTRAAPALIARGRIENQEGAISLIANHLEALSLDFAVTKSRDFR